MNELLYFIIRLLTQIHTNTEKEQRAIKTRTRSNSLIDELLLFCSSLCVLIKLVVQSEEAASVKCFTVLCVFICACLCAAPCYILTDVCEVTECIHSDVPPCPCFIFRLKALLVCQEANVIEQKQLHLQLVNVQ